MEPASTRQRRCLLARTASRRISRGSWTPLKRSSSRSRGRLSPIFAWPSAPSPRDRKSTRLNSSHTATTEIYTLSLHDALPISHLQGFLDTAQEVELEVARTVITNFRLAVGTVAEQVTVSASSPIIETATTSVGQVITNRTVQEIPLNGRHFVDLGTLIPGSVTPPQSGFLTAPLRGQGSFAFNTAGNREDTVNFMIN